MKTMRQIVGEKISAIQDLFAKYYELKREMDKLDTPAQGDQWNKLYMQTKPIKEDFKRSVCELASFLGFSVNEDNFKPSFANYEDIFCRLRVRWSISQVTLHQINNADKKFFDNAEYPFRDED